MHKASVGDVEVMALIDAPILMDPRHFMPQYSDQFLAEFGSGADSRGLFQMAVTVYLLRSAGKTMIVDTGLGNRRRPGFPPGKLDYSLHEAGIDPSEIDIVLNTHLHIDHVGWNTVDDEDGTRRVFFPNARFVFQQQEWDYWMQPEFLEQPSNAHLIECVLPLQDSGRIDFATHETAIDEHITFVPTPGHTPGHVAVGIMSAGERAVIIGDSSHHPAQLIHPDWSPSFDSDPVQAAMTRDRMFDWIIDEDRMMLGGHWEHPGIGRLRRLNGRRVFEAL
ncbi:MAG: MBL fold metallo-hydrolase [Dehalococcoidia bacterium]|nr:MBL fold metallo-hydrolase [Dehalococcoidia bacterium]